MELESSGSVDGGSEYEDSNAFDCYRGSDEGECGLADAFMQFEAQAEKRTSELLAATDRQLFQVSQEGEQLAAQEQEGADAEEGSFPAYVYMSDQFQLKKPPEFGHWQKSFHYLQVTGSRLFDGESMEHIQTVPMEAKAVSSEVGVDECKLRVEGHSCLLEPTPDSRAVYEEIILCDGLMEETLEHHEGTDDEMSGEAGNGKLPPYHAHVEEVFDGLTLECFSSTVAPLLTSFYQTMLEKHQQTVRTAREDREAAANRTIEEQVAFDRAQQLKLEQEALEEEARVEALELQRQEEEKKEVERREILLKQQLEENDEEEVKIKTLAYSHTREWYQPNKKCFSHRGRQLTYLKPVLQAKESEEMLMPVADARERSPPPNDDRGRARQSNILKKSRSTIRKPQPEWVSGGALTNDKLCDISWVKKIARPPASPPPSPTRASRSHRRRKNENQKDDATSYGGVQLPVIPRPGAATAAVTSKPTAPVRKRSTSPEFASAPPALAAHPASSYQVPPRVVAEANRAKNRRYYSAQ
ncbi:hypothetical protein PF008_g20099 [Phytophthora fragariae]|uniref:Uncharacterized protein n=1 Tax=Phytophthora fragariae TaxID=53985 RepID=A0A6G0R185_9STRA|nr:hypothetical protein PF008_g20099 [Phytophthora fragariae]